MQRQLDAFGLDYQFIDGVDKLELHSKEYRARTAHQLSIDESQMEHLYNSRAGVRLAVQLSHLKIYNLIIQHKVPLACVLEDDGYLRPTFPQILSSIQLFQDLSLDILLLSHVSDKLRALIAPPSVPFFYGDSLSYLYKLIYHKKYYPKLKLNSYFVRLMILKRVYTYFQVLFRLHIPYNWYFEIGAIPEMEKSSWHKTKSKHYIAKPSLLNERIASGMAYVLTPSATTKWREVALQHDICIDYIPYKLYESGEIDLGILVPPCVSAITKYIKYSPRKL